MSRMPKKMHHGWTARLRSVNTTLMSMWMDRLERTGWRFYAVDANRGYCAYAPVKMITIPVWALQKGFFYGQWYVAHEIAHAIVGHEEGHGDRFMQMLKSLCHAEAYKFEVTYQPKKAVANGLACFDF